MGTAFSVNFHHRGQRLIPTVTTGWRKSTSGKVLLNVTEKKNQKMCNESEQCWWMLPISCSPSKFFYQKWLTCHPSININFIQLSFLTTNFNPNVPGDDGSSRPKRVEPRFHCVDIAWQVQGRCVRSVAHSSPHTIAAHALSAARTIEPLPMHFVCVHALCVPHTHSAVCALCVGSCTLQPAHLAVHALTSFFHAIFNPFNLRSKQITPNNIWSQYHFLTQDENRDHPHNVLIMPLICWSSLFSYISITLINYS